MKRARVLKEFDSIDDAKKVEETVKTGYAETSIESLLHWAAVEEDLAESYLAELQAGQGAVRELVLIANEPAERTSARSRT